MWLRCALLEGFEGKFGAGAGVGAELAGAAHGGVADGRHFVVFDAGFHALQNRFDPLVTTLVGDDFGAEFEVIVEAVEVHAAVGVHEVAGVADGEAVLAQQPLVDLQLALVADLPRRIDADLAVFGGGFVVYDDEFAIFIDPDIIDSPKNM